jgi:phosphatidylserine decarboxylase
VNARSRPDPGRGARRGCGLSVVALAAGIPVLLVLLVLLRYAAVTDHLYNSLVKDPERVPPSGDVLVAPADGTVLYVTRVSSGIVPEMVKRGVAVPLVEHLKTEADRVFPDGWLVGIYMNGDSVHVNRVPVDGLVTEQIVFNGPHMDMSAAERTILLTQLVPGWVSFKKWLGLAPYAIESEADFVLKSARETLVVRDARATDVYVTRIADYAVGKILTWVTPGQEVRRGDRLGMITWGSQTDVFFAESPGLEVRARVGEFVYGGETVLATY